MAVASRGRPELSRPWKGREGSPERTKVWTEKENPKKFAVVYYLSRNGLLEHPHFMEVTPSSPNGLHLRDVINRLDSLRGKGMATEYAWSSKRSYRNGFVWHDLSEDDLIYPVHGQEYVLKGSELFLRSSSSPTSREITGSEMALMPAKMRKIPCNSFSFGEYKQYKNCTTASRASMNTTDEATQTDDNQRRQHTSEEGDRRLPAEDDNSITEIDSDEISPPPSSSTSGTIGVASNREGEVLDPPTGGYPSGGLRASASAMLMHLISCGSVSVKNSGRRTSLPPPASVAEMDGGLGCRSFSAVDSPEKGYFSGSLIQASQKKTNGEDEGTSKPGIKRSSSYNAERYSKVKIDGVRTGIHYIPPGKSKSMPTSKWIG